MALTGRDVMFTLRAQDMASRQVRNLAGSFGALDRQLRAMRAKEADDMARLTAQGKRVNQSYKDQIAATKQYRDQGLNRTTEAYNRQIKAIEKRQLALGPERDARIAAAQKTKAAHINMATRAYERQTAVRNSKLADNTFKRDERLAGIKDAQAKAIARTNAEYQKVSHTLGAQNDRLRTMNARINEQIRLNTGLSSWQKRDLRDQQATARAVIAQNTERINAARRVRDVEQQTIRANAKADNEQTKREAARRAETIKHAQTTARAKHEAHVSNLRAIEAAEVRAAKADFQRNSQRLAAAKAHAAAVRDSEQQGLKRAADARVAALKQEQQQYAQRLQMTKAAVRQRAEIEQQEIMRRQAMTQRAMMGGAALSMMGGLALGASAKVLNNLRSMAMEAMEFNRVIALALTQVDGFQSSVEELTGIALRVMREVPAAAETIPRTLYFLFSSLDVGIESAEGLLRGFAREAVAGNATVEDSARSTMAILNGMNLVSKDYTTMQENLTRVQDFQFQTVRKGIITYEQLSKNIGKVIPSLRRMGQEIEMGGAMLTFLTRAGLSVEMASTAAARSLELIGDPRVVRRMEDLGIAVRDDVTGEFLALDVILNQLAERIGDLPGPERAQAMLDLFGGAGYRIQARRFFDLVLPNIELFNQHVEWATNNAGSFERAYNTMFDTPAAKAQLLANNTQALRMEFGEKLFPILMQLVDVGRAIIDWIDRLDESMGGNLVTMVAYVAAAGAVVGALTLMIGLFLTMGSLISMATGKGVIGMTFASMGLFGAIIAVSGAVAYLIMNFNSLSDIMSSIRSYFSSVEGASVGVAIALGAVTAVMAIMAVTNATVTGTTFALIAALKAKAAAAFAVAASFSSILLANPLLLMFAALTVLAAGVAVALNKTSQEVKLLEEAIDSQYDAMKGQVSTITDSVEGFASYRRILDETAHATAEQTLKERDLEDALRRSTVTQHQYNQSLTGSSEQRKRVLDTMRQETEALRESGNWFDRLNSGALVEITTNAKRVSANEDLIETYEREVVAIKAAEAALRDEMRAQGGIHAAIANVMELRELQNNSILIQRDSYQDLIDAASDEVIALLEVRGAFQQLSPAMQEAVLSGEMTEDQMDDVAEAMRKAAEQGYAFADAMGSLTSPADAWSKAIEKINDGIEDTEKHIESLLDIDVDRGMAAWIKELEDGVDKSNNLFNDMAGLYSKYADDMEGHSFTVYNAILGMGEAGPEAMALLNSASPEDFLSMLEMIRLHAAWTSDEVREYAATMMLGMEHVIAAHGPDIEDRMGDIGNAIALIIAEYGGEITEDIIPRMMTTMAGAIANGTDLSIEEMVTFGAIIADLAARGGDGAVEGLLNSLENGTTSIGNVMRQYTAAIAAGLDPVLLSLGKPRITFSGAQMRNRGGLIPGGGPDRDSVLTALTPGEYVLRRKAVNNLDLHALEELNRTGDINTLVKRYNSGGFVTSADIPKPPSSYAPPVVPMTSPAAASDERKYNEVKKFMDNYSPPLSGGVGWQAMWQAVSSRFPGVNLHSAFRPGAITATGNPSYHGMGRAIDISPRMDIFNWLASRYRNSREIIFSPAGMRQIHNGRNHMYSGITRAMHWDHIHWAMANGGMVTGPTPALIGEAGPEVVIPLDKLGPIFSKAVGDGYGIGDNFTGAFTGGISGLNSWTPRAITKYQKAMREATAENIESVRKMMNAIGAMRTHLEAQHGLAEARRNVTNLRNEITKLAGDAKAAQIALNKAWDEARKITAEEELSIISARQQVRKAEQDYASFHNGIYALNQELSELQQEQRIAQMRQSLEELGEGDFGNIAELKDNLQAAKATLSGAQFEWARVQTILPTMTDEVEKLLLQFKTENALADAQQAYTDAGKALQEAERGNIDSLHARRIAEIELQLAEQQLNDFRKERLHTDEAARQAQLQLQLAQENLTQTEKDAIGPTDAVREAQERLKEIREQQKEATNNLRQAQIDASLAEFTAIEATLGMISAGQELVNLGPEQVRFFRELAAAAGMSASSINSVVSATRQLGGASADIQKAISQHSGVDRRMIEEGFDSVYKRVKAIFDNRRVRIATADESERQRLTRIAHEVLSGTRTLDSVRSSVDRLQRLGIGTYDQGGILPPGFTLAYNGTGKNEHIYTHDQNKKLGGTTLIVEEGAFQLTVEGNMDSDVLPKVETMLEDFITDLESEFNRN